MAIAAVFEPSSSRVRLAGTALGAATWATFWSRRAGAATWKVVRGGWQLPISGGSAPVHYDYEFPVVESEPGVVEYLVSTSAGVSQHATVNVSIAGQCWIKWCGFPFLNRPVAATGRGPVKRGSRGDLLPIVSQRAGIAVQEFTSGRTFDLTVRTTTWAEYRSLDDALSLGSILWVHADEAALGAPSMYATVASVTSEHGPRSHGQTRYTTITLEECAAPAYFYAGSIGTWQTVLNGAASWQNLLDTYETWGDVASVQGSAADVVVA